jgi:hypothetical protein
MHSLTHQPYLAYHHFDFLLVDYPAFHACIGGIALVILLRQNFAVRRQKRMERRQIRMERRQIKMANRLKAL